MQSAQISSRRRLQPLDLSPRPTSAQANMQSHPCYQASLFYDNQRAAGSLQQWKERVNKERPSSTQAAAASRPGASEAKRDYQLENAIWTQSVKQARRMTLTNTQNITDWEIVLLKKQKSYAVAALGELKGKLEEKLTLDALNELNELFVSADHDGSGALELEEFKIVIKGALKIEGRNDEEIAALFMKIDSSCDGQISWEEFCTFLQLNFSEKEDSVKRQKEVAFNTPARTENNPHRHNIQKVACTGDSQFMVMAADGQCSFWTPTGKLKNVRKDIIEKRVIAKSKGEKSDAKRSRLKWITDFVVMTEFSKIIVGTGDCELQFWELSSFGLEPYCQVCSLETAPIKISYACTDRDYVTIAYGDTDGCVNIFIFSAMGETLRLWKASPIIAQMPGIHLTKALESKTIKFIRWKVHNDWVEQIRIEQRINQIISCSNDENNALVIGCVIASTDLDSHLTSDSKTQTQSIATMPGSAASIATQQQQQQPLNASVSVSQNADYTTGTDNMSTTNNTVTIQVPTSSDMSTRRQSQLPQQGQQQQQQTSTNAIIQSATMVTSQSSISIKRRPDNNETVFKVYKGVKCFDFSMEKNLLITGGMDRIIRLYNPYVPGRPIARLKRHNAPIFYIHLSNEDNRIFTMSTDKCLNVWDIVDHSCLACMRPKAHKINGELQACAYNPSAKSILVCTDKVSLLSLKIKANQQTEVILSHKEAVTCCMYNKQFKQLISCTETGTVKLWDLETGRDIFEFTRAHGDAAITCMTFDETGRRLITGGRDGTCKIWNFNNGHCLKVLRKDNKQEITDVRYVKIYNNKFIINVGWDRRINIYDDDIDDVRLYAEPNARWSDDVENGHQEDITCLAKSDSNLLATASYDGEIIVWNMVSGHIFCKLNSPRPDDHQNENLDGDLSVNKIIFLPREHLANKAAAHLISSGPWGMIHFWNIFTNELYGRFKVDEHKGTHVSQMIIDSKCSTLFAADNHGFIYVWNVDGYATRHKEYGGPELLKCWRAHVEGISSIEFIESAKVIVSCSSDCTIRVWSLDGMFIGTFGQNEIWNLYDPLSYQHPLVPYDVLVDEQSMPQHELLSKKETMSEVLEIEKQKEDEKAKEKEVKQQQHETWRSKIMPVVIVEKAAKTFHAMGKANHINDDQIAQQIKNMRVNPEKIGKRLRHEKHKPIIAPDRGVKSHFQMLKCFEYDDAPKVEIPVVIKNKSMKNDDFYY